MRTAAPSTNISRVTVSVRGSVGQQRAAAPTGGIFGGGSFTRKRRLARGIYRQFHIPRNFCGLWLVSPLCAAKLGPKVRNTKVLSPPMALCQDYVWMKSFTQCRPDWRLPNEKKKLTGRKQRITKRQFFGVKNEQLSFNRCWAHSLFSTWRDFFFFFLPC